MKRKNEVNWTTQSDALIEELCQFELSIPPHIKENFDLIANLTCSDPIECIDGETIRVKLIKFDISLALKGLNISENFHFEHLPRDQKGEISIASSETKSNSLELSKNPSIFGKNQIDNSFQFSNPDPELTIRLHIV